MLILLLVVSLMLTWVLCWLAEPATEGRTRLTLLKAIIVQSVTIVLLTELLSVFQSLNPFTASIIWLGIISLQGGILLSCWQGQSSGLQFQVTSYLPVQRWQQENGLVTIALIAILAITLLTALLAPPNHWDVMTYHLPRVMHWLQNQTVAHYPTSDLRQLALVPGAGYLVAHLYLLAGDDRWVNLVQWLAFLGCIAGVSLISQMLSGKTAAGISALVCASVPMAILQSMTCQTDLLTALWLICFTYFALQPLTFSQSASSPVRLRFSGQRRRLHWPIPWSGNLGNLWMTAALGLSILTKPTAWIFSFPLLLLALIVRSERWHQTTRWPRWQALGRSTLLMMGLGFASLSLTLPSFWRNYQTLGSWLGSEHQTRNTLLGPLTVVSNLLKNLALNLPIPGIWHLVDYLHTQWLRISPDDPRLSFAATPLTDPNSGPTKALLKVVAPHEDFVGYPVHLILGLLAIAFLIHQLPRYLTPAKWPVLALAAVFMSNGLLFCLLLKWQPWGNRLILPVILLFVPIIADYLVHGLSPKLRSWILGGLAIMAIAYALTPLRHPLISLPTGSLEQSASILTLPRSALYFSGARKELAIPYQRAAQRIGDAGCNKVGFVLTGESWEYALWVSLRQQGLKDLKIRHVWVQNPSRSLPAIVPETELCAILSTEKQFPNPDHLFPAQAWRSYPIAADPFVQVFLAEPY